MKYVIFFLAGTLLFSCSRKNYKEPHILISTRYGDIEAELYPDKAPKTVAAFLSYVDERLYKNTSFYRVIKEDDLSSGYNSGLIQGGVWQVNSSKLPVQKIEHESTKQSGLSHTNGTLSLARTTPGSASSEFFICIGNQSQFNAGASQVPDSLGFAAFGRVVKGMDAVRKIQSQKNTGDKFDEQIIIDNIERL